MRRSQKRVCGLESRLGEEQAWSIEDDCKQESDKEADDCSIFNKIVREEGDSVLMLLVSKKGSGSEAL